VIVNPITNNPTVRGSHKGAVIHHHDQAATCPISASFKVRNIRNIIVNIGNDFFFDIL
jgi:hypothetical protein